MTNPLNGNDQDDTAGEFESEIDRIERERLERERIEAEQADIDDSEYEGETPFAAEEAERLSLGEEERLPWLESDDEYADDVVDTARIATVALLGLLAIVTVAAIIWWFMRDKPDAELLAEGSTIEAPAEPFRARPANPGGRNAEGTGDVSYAVGEGRDRATQMGGSAPTPSATPTPAATAARPSIDRQQAAGAAPSVAAPTAAAAAGGVGVQVGAFSSRATADAGWAQLTREHSALSGVNHRIVQAQVDGNTVFRLQAVAGNASAAEAMCRAIKSGGGDCRVAN